MRCAIVGDVHGVIDEFDDLLRLLDKESLDSIWHVGDLVDRGPDSGAVVRRCRQLGIGGVLGNHESTIIKRYDVLQSGGKVKPSEDKDRTLSTLTADDIEYLRGLPLLHVLADFDAVLVHGGLEPGELWKQSQAACHLQLIHPGPRFRGQTRWWGYDVKHECTEEENRANGWRRWYELSPEEGPLVIYGHSVFPEPFRYKQTLGIDTGGCFGGDLTAVILPDMRFVKVPARRRYAAKGTHPMNPYMTDPV